MNRQRERIYEWRNEILVRKETGALVSRWMEETIGGVVTEEFGPLAPSDWDWEKLNRELEIYYPSSLSPPAGEGTAHPRAGHRDGPGGGR